MLGIGMVMLTGDHPSTARAIAYELGLMHHGSVVTGAELMSMSEEALILRLATATVFARLYGEMGMT
jgi:P-type Ca2+ transporter type 2C